MIHLITPENDDLPTGSYPPHHLFLAGAIDNGKAEDWQSQVLTTLRNKLENLNFLFQVVNPRRNNWNPKVNSTFDQATWEIEKLTDSKVIFFRFLAGSDAPITLYELGTCIGQEITIHPTAWGRRSIIISADSNYSKIENLRAIHNEAIDWSPDNIFYFENNNNRAVDFLGQHLIHRFSPYELV